MARIGILPGFGFLVGSANFEIGESVIPFQAGDTYLRAIVAGLLNTLKVSLLGCLLATVFGVTIGVAGLSSNLLLSKIIRWYIEIVRNTPLLLQLFFWISLAKALPAPRQADGPLRLGLPHQSRRLPPFALAGGRKRLGCSWGLPRERSPSSPSC